MAEFNSKIMMGLQEWVKRPEVVSTAEKLVQQVMIPKNLIKIVAGAVLAVLPITAVAEYRKAARNTELLDIIAAEEQRIIDNTPMVSDRAVIKQQIQRCDRADFICESDANQAHLVAVGLDAVDQELRILPDTVRVCREQQLECLGEISH